VEQPAGQRAAVLIVVTNNGWGISTSAAGQHGEKHIADRARAFNIRAKTIDGNDPETAYRELQEAMEYVRRERKPFMIEAMVSRLYGHSSASGANFVQDEADCLKIMEAKLEQRGILTRQQMDEVRTRHTDAIAEMYRRIREEPQPGPETIWNHIYSTDRS
jgi:2-oxoisovalerate dehydrogenase E1 component alpha subunit